MTLATSILSNLGWIEAGLIICFVVFVLIVLGVVFRRRGHFDEAARIPLDDDPASTDSSKTRPGEPG